MSVEIILVRFFIFHITYIHANSQKFGRIESLADYELKLSIN